MNAYLGVGDLLDGKYRIVRVIGEGGWGVVYEGENVRTLKRVAIKVLRSHADVTADIRARFEREAQAGGRIGSAHIIEVFDLGVLSDGTHFMVMELLVGEDLGRRLRSVGPLPPVVAAKLVIQVLEGLAAAHAAGVLHRDLKPENLFLVRTRSGEDFVKILDFGVSKFNAPGDPSATRTGAVLGSPFYMAPEQARGLKHIDGRTDLYSVGALFFESVTGRVPFDGENFNDLMFKIALSPRPNPLHFQPNLDPVLVAILMKSIAADPRERFATAEEFGSVLAAWVVSQGASPSRAPEILDAQRGTPRPSSESLSASTRIDPLDPAHASPVRDPMRASPVRTSSLPPGPAASPAETPMASSSSVPLWQRVRRRPVFLFVCTAVVLLCGAGAVAWQRLHGASEGGPTVTRAPAAPEEHARAVDPPPVRLNDPTATPPLEPAPSAPPASPENIAGHPEPPPPPATAAANRWPATPAPSTGRGPSSPPVRVVLERTPTPPPSVESTKGAADPPPPPPSASTPVVPFEKVEGREVRTRL
ncbi:MAG TPA: protein kinase [Polyangiaceae bacterium]|jgi:serine/threonine-protein kinase